MKKQSGIIIGLVPARGGSKGVKKKNLQRLAGRPLIAYAIECGLACKSIDKIIVSTDDPDIAETARQWGADVPFMRPSELSLDDTPMLPVLQHSIREAESIYSNKIDTLVLLQPTSPLRTVDDVEDALALYHRDSSCQAVISGHEAHFNPYFSMAVLEKGMVRLALPVDRDIYGRQNCPPVYNLDGTVWIYSREAVMDLQQRIPPQTRLFIVPGTRVVEIDTETDLEIARLFISKKRSQRTDHESKRSE
jgi:CMP-N,N'-diacetyllegionaminic acid synthase